VTTNALTRCVFAFSIGTSCKLLGCVLRVAPAIPEILYLLVQQSNPEVKTIPSTGILSDLSGICKVDDLVDDLIQCASAEHQYSFAPTTYLCTPLNRLASQYIRHVFNSITGTRTFITLQLFKPIFGTVSKLNYRALCISAES